MNHNSYIKETLYAKINEKRQISESNQRIKRLTEESREKLREHQMILNKSPFKSDRSQKSKPLNKSLNGSDKGKIPEPGIVFRNNIINQISNKANEYEKAIQQYLGVNHKDIKIEKLRKVKEKRADFNRPQSSIDFNKEEAKDPWSDELKKIELQEKNLEKNLNILSVKQKKLKVQSKSVKAPLKVKENNEIFKSLEQVNKLLTNLLKSNKNDSPKRK